MGRPRHRDTVAVSDPVHQPLEPANTSRRHAELGSDSLHRRDRRRDHRAAHGQMILARRHWDQSGERTTGSLPYLHATEPSAPHQAAFTSQVLAGAVMNGRIPATVLDSTWASSARTRPMWLSPVRDLVHVTVSPAAKVHVGFNTARRSVDPRSRRRFTSIRWALRDRPARDEAALRHGG